MGSVDEDGKPITDEDGNNVGTGIFVYGQMVGDFHMLKKEVIFATGIAALQEVDRQQVADKARIATLESQVAVLLNFTGQHRTFIKNIPTIHAKNFEGLIVSACNDEYIKMSGGISSGTEAITINESLPVVSLTTKAKDKSVFGVISGSEDPNERTEKEVGDTRVYINSVGEGAIWVCNINGSLESGDYITSSNLAYGYGQKQDTEFQCNYTVAKITMNCDFNPQQQMKKKIKQTKDLVNDLDEHGQIQWETTNEFEQKYKTRFLDSTGNITDEQHHVYKAAFVGCTYHCG
jgi:hypothetical protein